MCWLQPLWMCRNRPLPARLLQSKCIWDRGTGCLTRSPSLQRFSALPTKIRISSATRSVKISLCSRPPRLRRMPHAWGLTRPSNPRLSTTLMVVIRSWTRQTDTPPQPAKSKSGRARSSMSPLLRPPAERSLARKMLVLTLSLAKMLLSMQACLNWLVSLWRRLLRNNLCPLDSSRLKPLFNVKMRRYMARLQRQWGQAPNLMVP